MDVLERIRRLVAINTISSPDPRLDQGNRLCIELLAQWLEDLGFAVEVQPLADPRKANLVARYGSGPGGLVLAGHSDTVPCDEALWSSDPFRAEVRDGRIYGLGTADMKSFFALAIAAFEAVRGEPFREPLYLVATADEESSMAGAQALVAAGPPLGRRALIGEPTGLKPVSMHKGILVARVEVEGQSGHSSDPALGRSALDTMARILAELLALRRELAECQSSPAFAVPHPTLNLGAIRGGDNFNRICGHCRLDFEIRPLPGTDVDQLAALLRERLTPLGEPEGTRVVVDCRGIPPFSAEGELLHLCRQLSGAEPTAVAFATEAPFFSRLGLDVTVLGPGEIAQAHQPDEYLALAQIPPALSLLERLIAHCCLTPRREPPHGL